MFDRSTLHAVILRVLVGPKSLSHRTLSVMAKGFRQALQPNSTLWVLKEVASRSWRSMYSSRIISVVISGCRRLGPSMRSALTC